MAVVGELLIWKDVQEEKKYVTEIQVNSRQNPDIAASPFSGHCYFVV